MSSPATQCMEGVPGDDPRRPGRGDLPRRHQARDRAPRRSGDRGAGATTPSRRSFQSDWACAEVECGGQPRRDRRQPTHVPANLINSPQPQASVTLGLLNRKPEFEQAAGVVDLGAEQEHLGHRRDHHPGAVLLDHLVVGMDFGDVVHGVFHAGAPALLHADAQALGVALDISRAICASAAGVIVTGALPGTPNIAEIASILILPLKVVRNLPPLKGRRRARAARPAWRSRSRSPRRSSRACR